MFFQYYTDLALNCFLKVLDCFWMKILRMYFCIYVKNSDLYFRKLEFISDINEHPVLLSQGHAITTIVTSIRVVCLPRSLSITESFFSNSHLIIPAQPWRSIFDFCKISVKCCTSFSLIIRAENSIYLSEESCMRRESSTGSVLTKITRNYLKKYIKF